ncbi:MAG: hypothetical protein ACI8WB_001106 [Phenylobacterium sp.]|jgi:hypothetical protein
MMNNNSTQTQIDITQSFAAFCDITEQTNFSTEATFKVKEHAAFGQFVTESSAFPSIVVPS